MLKLKKLIGTFAAAACIFAGANNVMADAKVDPAIADYQKVSGISGKLSSVGSDTLANLMTMWQEEFKKNYPNVDIQIQAQGSSTAPPALTEGTSSLGPMSRPMKAEEIKAFEDKHGYKPTEIKVAIDAIAVYVHKDNPIKSLSFPQVDAIFSTTRKCGFNEEVTTWGQLDIEGKLAKQAIQLFGRNSVSGTYGYFKEKALCKGDYKKNVNEQPGSSAVINAIAESPNGVGYSGIGYLTANVKTVALSKKPGDEAYTPEVANVLAGKYPLSRFLLIYVNKKPNQPVSPLEKEFVKMVLSKVGQEVVVKDGFVPLPKKIVDEELKKLD